MTIETKYNVGDWLWLMYSDEAVRMKIISWEMIATNETMQFSTRYNLEGIRTNTYGVWESKLFATKADLLNSL